MPPTDVQSAQLRIIMPYHTLTAITFAWVKHLQFQDLHQRVCAETWKMLCGCVDMQLSAGWFQRAVGALRCLRSALPVYTIWYPPDFKFHRHAFWIRRSSAAPGVPILNGFRFSVKYAKQNHHLNEGNLHELKLRLKIVRYPGIEVVL